jgi:AmmeMemoRadiSam system protein A
MSRLCSEDWVALVEIAHRAIFSTVLEERLPDLPPYSEALAERRGAFVSLYHAGKLRGCVGQVENPGPLAEVVARAAINAARNDSRFPAVQREEVPNLDVEISVLSSLERILPEAVIVGQHGLMVVRGGFRGLLLPQVAAEREWSALRLLEETCMKAGLPQGAWRDPGTEIFGFTAEVFSEKGHRTVSSL